MCANGCVLIVKSVQEAWGCFNWIVLRRFSEGFPSVQLLSNGNIGIIFNFCNFCDAIREINPNCFTLLGSSNSMNILFYVFLGFLHFFSIIAAQVNYSHAVLKKKG